MSPSTSSKRASPGDFVWYNSEGDDEPIPQKAKATAKDTNSINDPKPTEPEKESNARPQRAAARANPYIFKSSVVVRKNPFLVGAFKSGLGDLNHQLGLVSKATSGNNSRPSKPATSLPLSANALGKRKALEPPDDEPTPTRATKHSRQPLRDITDHYTDQPASPVAVQVEADAAFAKLLQDRIDRRLSEPDSVDDQAAEAVVVDAGPSRTRNTVSLRDSDTDGEEASKPPPATRRIVKKNSTARIISDEEGEDEGDQFNDEELAVLGAQDYSKRGRFGVGREPSHKSDDVRTIFEVIAVKENGALVKYYRCLVCWNEGKPINKRYRFGYAGGVSNLRKHIRSVKDHFSLYEERCTERGIAMHQRAVPANRDQPSTEIQTQLAFPPAAPKPAAFSREGLVKFLTAFVVCNNQPFQLVDDKAFRELCIYIRPSLTEEDIPHRTTITREIQSQANHGFDTLRNKLAEVDSLISLTYDFGESPFAKDPYLPITGSWISGSASSPTEWQIHTQCFAFRVVHGRHNAYTLAHMLYSALEDLGIIHKLGWPVGDNLTVNDKAMRILGRYIRRAPNPEAQSTEAWTNPMSRRGRCTEHSFNLAIGDVINTVCPTTFAALCKKLSDQLEAEPEDVDEEELPELVDDADESEGSESGGEDRWDQDDEEAEDEEDDDIDVADTVSKILAIVRILRKSTQARLFFEKQCLECGLSVKRLKTFVKTRWSSMYDVLERYLQCKQALRRFFLLADDDEQVPRMRSRKINNYAQLRLSDDEWVLVKLLLEVLKPVALACQSWSSDDRPALYRALPAIEFLIEQWEARLRNPEYQILHDAIQAGLDSLLKYYRHMDDTDIYIITIFLIPRWKMRYIERRWDAKDSRKALKVVQHVFDQYARCTPSKPKTPSRRRSPPSASSSQLADNNYGISWMESVLAEDIDDEPTNPREELTRYLNSPRDLECDDAVLWWGRRQDEYPILSRMARDYLAIPASSTASERLFSSAGLIGTVRRTSITPKNFEAVQFLKSSYKVGDMSAEKEIQRLRI